MTSDNIIRSFRALINIPSPSSFEKRISNHILSTVEHFADEAYIDNFNNVIAIMRGSSKKSIMLSAHIDEVGMIVKYIDDNGYIYFDTIGALDPCILVGQRVTVWHNDNMYMGVIGRRPIHILSDSDVTTVKADEVWIDLGSKGSTVDVGDYITFTIDNFTEYGDGVYSSHSVDNKIGCAILIELMAELQRNRSEHTLYFVFSTQEEVGCRGVQVAAQALNPNEAIIIDAIHATDYPTINNRVYGDVKLGKGAVFTYSVDISRDLTERIVNGVKNSIQRYVTSRYSCTEAKSILITNIGVQTAVISYPVRYMHSVNELFNIEDVESIYNIIIHYIHSNKK
ncbi:MAG: M20/M25/M40 family metallo-hydrolase [Rikenellaceae bacterium]